MISMVIRMKTFGKGARIRPFALLILCVCTLAIVLFWLMPKLRETINLTREYGATPDNWVYCVILAGCVLVFCGSLFLLFHGEFRRDKGGEDSPD